MNVEPTAEVIDNMVKSMTDYAKELTRISTRLRETKDITYASEAVTTVSNMMNQLRLDLLVTRPIRELLYQIEKTLP